MGWGARLALFVALWMLTGAVISADDEEVRLGIEAPESDEHYFDISLEPRLVIGSAWYEQLAARSAVMSGMENTGDTNDDPADEEDEESNAGALSNVPSTLLIVIVAAGTGLGIGFFLRGRQNNQTNRSSDSRIVIRRSQWRYKAVSIAAVT